MKYNNDPHLDVETLANNIKRYIESGSEAKYEKSIYSKLFYAFDQSDYLDLFHKVFDVLPIPHFFMTASRDTYKNRDYSAQVYPIEGIDILDNLVSLDKKTRILFISFFYKIYLIRNFKNYEYIGIFLPFVDDALNNRACSMIHISKESKITINPAIEKTNLAIARYNSSVDYLIRLLEQFKLPNDSSFKQMITVKKALQRNSSVYSTLLVDIDTCIENKGSI